LLAWLPRSKIYDDHIFSAKHNDRILQVIQRESVSDKPFLRARVQKWDDRYDMLVLSIELSSEIKPALKKIIRAWLMDGALEKEVRGLAEV
jgi:Lon protease-like protein